MNSIREVVGTLFKAPMQNMSFISYFQYVNESGKITSRSLLELSILLLVFAEEQEKINASYKQDFNHIEEILKKIVDKKVEKKEPMMTIPDIDKLIDIKEFENPSDPAEALRLKRVENMAKARSMRKKKT